MEKNISLSINQEIQRFESVHPLIYQIYDLVDGIDNLELAQAIRENVVNVEDSFVNSMEWTLSRNVETIHIGLLGSVDSPKSTLVHRYLTGQYLQDNSPEGGRFKKELLINNKPYLLLIRDEGSSPTLQFTHWLDVLLLIANDLDSVKLLYSYVMKLANYKTLSDIPTVLVATSNSNFLEEFKKIPHNIFMEVNVEKNINVDTLFEKACSLVVKGTKRKSIFINKDKELGSGRVIPIKQGYLLKKSYKLKKFKKKYVVLSNHKLNYYDNLSNYMDKKHNKFIELNKVSVKTTSELKFELKTFQKSYEFECVNKLERDEWIQSIEKQVCISLIGNSHSNVLSLHGNSCCADCCGDKDVTWVSINFGTVLCIDCSGVHRSVGCHVSRVRSLLLDCLSPTTIKILQSFQGNTVLNNLYENTLKNKIIPTTSTEDKLTFIKNKYEKLLYLPNNSYSKQLLFESVKNKQFILYIYNLLKLRPQINNYLLELIELILSMSDKCVYLQVLMWQIEDVNLMIKGVKCDDEECRNILGI